MKTSLMAPLAKNSGINLANCCLFILLSREREGIVGSDILLLLPLGCFMGLVRQSSVSLAPAILFVVMDQLTRGNRARSGEVADVGQHHTNMMLIQC